MIYRFLLGALTGTGFVAVSMVVTSAISPVKQPSFGAGVTQTEAGLVSESGTLNAGADIAEANVSADQTGAMAEEVATEEFAADGGEVTVEVETQPMVSETPPVLPAAPDSSASEDDGTEAAANLAEVEAPKSPRVIDSLAVPTGDEAEGAFAETEAGSSEPETESAAAEPGLTAETTGTGELEIALGTDATSDAMGGSPASTDPAPAEPDAIVEEDGKAAPEGENAAETLEPDPETDSFDPTETEGEPVPDETPEAEIASGADPEKDQQGSTFLPTPGFGTDEASSTFVDQGETAEADLLAETPVADQGAMSQYAAAFDNPSGKPVLAIVLIDNGAPGLDRQGLADLPFPVSFALDPLDPGTPANAAIYRAAGREVIMLATGFAEGAEATDVEVAFQAMVASLPEAVAVMDMAQPMFQNNRPLASLVVPVLGGEGRGLLTWDKGLNAADQVARRDDIAAAVIFRDLATGGGDAAAAQRTLDRAVFKAGQDGYAVVAGEITPDLVTALLEWSVEGRAAEVALGPLTAVLKVD